MDKISESFIFKDGSNKNIFTIRPPANIDFEEKEKKVADFDISSTDSIIAALETCTFYDIVKNFNESRISEYQSFFCVLNFEIARLVLKRGTLSKEEYKAEKDLIANNVSFDLCKDGISACSSIFDAIKKDPDPTLYYCWKLISLLEKQNIMDIPEDKLHKKNRNAFLKGFQQLQTSAATNTPKSPVSKKLTNLQKTERFFSLRVEEVKKKRPLKTDNEKGKEEEEEEEEGTADQSANSDSNGKRKKRESPRHKPQNSNIDEKEDDLTNSLVVYKGPPRTKKITASIRNSEDIISEKRHNDDKKTGLDSSALFDFFNNNLVNNNNNNNNNKNNNLANNNHQTSGNHSVVLCKPPTPKKTNLSSNENNAVQIFNKAFQTIERIVSQNNQRIDEITHRNDEEKNKVIHTLLDVIKKNTEVLADITKHPQLPKRNSPESNDTSNK